MKPGSKPTTAISMGDPAGIGPEIIVRALADPDVAAMANWVIVGDGDIWRKSVASSRTGVPLDIVPNLPDATRRGQFMLLDCGELKGVRVRPGTLNADCGRAALEYVRVATHLAKQQEVDAIVTAPLNKEAVVLTGVQFTGHTEYIAELWFAKMSSLARSRRISNIQIEVQWWGLPKIGM